MDDYRRYAIYHSPDGAVGAFGAAWLGWDSRAARAVPHPDMPGLDLAAITATPRPYGFHATLKAPFRLAAGATQAALRTALHDLATTHPPVTLPALRLTRLGNFLALTAPPSQPLAALEADTVHSLERFRAPLTAAEIARRQPDRLSPRQRHLLDSLGYPYALEEFRFHLTLTGALDPATATRTEAALVSCLATLPLAPYRLDSLSLAGEDGDGRFRVIDTTTLSG